MGFCDSLVRACEMEYRYNGQHPVDAHEVARRKRAEERMRQRERLEQMQSSYLVVPLKFKRFAMDRKRLASAVKKEMAKT